jgi:hypothetical protein
VYICFIKNHISGSSFYFWLNTTLYNLNTNYGVGVNKSPPVTDQHDAIQIPRPELHATIATGIADPAVVTPNVNPDAA